MDKGVLPSAHRSSQGEGSIEQRFSYNHHRRSQKPRLRLLQRSVIAAERWRRDDAATVREQIGYNTAWLATQEVAPGLKSCPGSCRAGGESLEA